MTCHHHKPDLAHRSPPLPFLDTPPHQRATCATAMPPPLPCHRCSLRLPQAAASGLPGSAACLPKWRQRASGHCSSAVAKKKERSRRRRTHSQQHMEDVTTLGCEPGAECSAAEHNKRSLRGGQGLASPSATSPHVPRPAHAQAHRVRMPIACTHRLFMQACKHSHARTHALREHACTQKQRQVPTYHVLPHVGGIQLGVCFLLRAWVVYRQLHRYIDTKPASRRVDLSELGKPS